MIKSDLTGILLCGGKSTRMGSDKFSQLYNQIPLYKPALHVLELNCEHVLVSSNVNYPEFANYQLINDEHENIGPIGGILACLKKSSTTYNLIMACDMPFITGNIVKEMRLIECNFEAIVPLNNGQAEPLYAIYNKSICSKLEKLILQNKYSLRKMLSELTVCYLDVNEHVSEFVNVNTLAELRAL
ncbi:MAG: molybdenum cofactor guanylyltransferase [Paludibacter sp.]|nr:molybdenum cofactor guanylyltransferase [Paludibacter sp.]